MGSRGRSAATLGVLVMLCLLGILFGIRGLTAELPTEPLVEDANAVCEDRVVEDGQKIRSDEITVSVFNGGKRAGAASKVLSALQERGFAAGETGNAEDTGVIRAQVWADRRNNAAALLVARQFGPSIKVFQGKPDLGPGIVVVVGDDLGKMVKAPQQTKAVGETRLCSPPVS
jgi:hypothetical protein